MPNPPVTSELRRGSLFVWLDTPGPINVLTAATASELVRIFENLPSPLPRAVVLLSRKPNSFLNGTSLLLAGALQTMEDVPRATAPARRAYRAIRECPVPTIAAIGGACYGCGIELTLQCRYRVARDASVTEFYMTEIPEYLFIPTFGGTQDLPRLVGLRHAAELILWGTRWSAREAALGHLVDACLSAATFEEDLEAFVEAETASTRVRRPPVPAPLAEDVQAQRRRIDLLPEMYRELYTNCLNLMIQALRAPEEAATVDSESLESARSVLAPTARSAIPFFFIREMANAVAAGERTSAPASKLVAGDAGAEDFCAPFSPQLPGRDAPLASAKPFRLRSTGSPGHTPSTETDVTLHRERGSGSRAARADLAIYQPFASLRVAEVAASFGLEADARRLGASLGERHFSVLPSRPRDSFFLDDLIAAWTAPQVAYLRAGGPRESLAATLRNFGFTRFAGDLTEGELPRADTPDGVLDPNILVALLLSLGAFALRALAERVVTHVSVLDVAMREVVDFPLGRTSFCRYLTPERATELLVHGGSAPACVAPDRLAAVRTYAAGGRPFYRGRSTPSV